MIIDPSIHHIIVQVIFYLHLHLHLILKKIYLIFYLMAHLYLHLHHLIGYHHNNNNSNNSNKCILHSINPWIYHSYIGQPQIGRTIDVIDPIKDLLGVIHSCPVIIMKSL